MHKTNTKLFAVVLTVMLTCALICGIVCTSDGRTAAAEPDIATTDVKIAHITDLHYFPYDYCYTKDVSDEVLHATEYYKSTSSDTKMFHSSGTVLYATIQSILAERADYVVVSGDLTKDSELEAHMDVANALRYLQNEMRKYNANAQVFVTPGNHDLYNTNACKFDTETGVKTKSSDMVTDSATFAKIYNGLGYPAISAETLAAAEASTIEYELKRYFGNYIEASSYMTQYIYSPLAANIAFTYFNNQIDEVNGVVGWPTEEDRALNTLTYVAKIDNLGYTILGIDSTEREMADGYTNSLTGETMYWEHLTGGRIGQVAQAWLTEQTASSREAEHTIISILHHNVAPHFSMEENYTKDFTLYNWEETGSFLADDAGVRYAFTGHMHANDRMLFTSYKGNTIQDFETGSLVSLFSPTRFTKFNREYTDGVLTEDVYTVTVRIQTLNGVYSLSIDDATRAVCKYNDVTDLEFAIGDEIYDKLVQRLLDGWVNDGLADTLKNLVNGVDFTTLLFGMLGPYDSLIKDLADTLVDDIFFNLDYNIDGVVAESLSTMLHDTVYKNDVLGMVVYQEGEEVYTLEQVAIWCYKSHIMGNEPATLENAETPMGRAAHKAMQAMVDGSLIETFLQGLIRPLLTEDNSLIKQLLYHKFDINEVITADPTNAKLLFDMLYDEDSATNPLNNGGFFVLNDLLSAPLVADTILPIVSGLVGGSIGDMISEAIAMGVDVWAEDIINKYLTKSFYTAIGGILADTLASFATDSTTDGATYDYSADGVAAANYVHVNDKAGSTVTYDGSPFTLAQNVPTFEDGRLPSHLTSTFGNDAATSYNFKWYTHYTVGGSFEYRVKGATEWTTATVTTAYTAISFPLIDLGIFATTTDTDGVYDLSDAAKTLETLKNCETEWDDGVPTINGNTNSTKFRAVHSVALTGLTADTEYEYRVYGTYDMNDDGDVLDADEKYCLQDYVADWEKGTPYSFKTALAKGSNEDFTFLAFSDVQGTIKTSYYEALSALNAAGNAVDYDFLINCGDMVDNGKNYVQWGFAHNILSTVFGNTATVVAAGNHEKSDYALSSYYSFGNAPEQSTETGVYYSFTYGSARFIVLNTNDYNEDGLGTEQLAWLNDELDAANADTAIKHTVVMMHKGLYSVGSHVSDAEVIAMRAQLTPIFYNKGVDLVLQGHDHTYNVTQVLDAEGNAVTDVTATETGFTKTADMRGVIYITLGTIADKYYEYRTNETLDGKLNEEQTIYQMLDAPLFFGITLSSDGSVSVDSYAYADIDGQGAKAVALTDYKASLQPVVVTPPEESSNWILWVGIVVVVLAVGITVFFVVRENKLMKENKSPLQQ